MNDIINIKQMKTIFYLTIGNILHIISYLIPKSNRIWIFGSFGGHEFIDNSKYFYNYIRLNHPEINAIWITKNPVLYNKLKKDEHTVLMCNSVKGIYYSCRAKFGMTCHGMHDLNRIASARIKIIQAWHGIPMKPVLLSDPKESEIQKRKKTNLLSYFIFFLKKEVGYDKNFIVLSSSDYVTETILQICFGKNSPLRITGFPRLDGLFSPNMKSEISQKIQSLKKEGKKIGIYMPTYRRENESDIVSLFVSNFQKIEKYLKLNNQVLFLKLHPFEHYKIKGLKTSENIYFIENKEIENDIYSILSFFDFLISDYSSIIFDYLLLSRPTYLLVPDREDYISTNGNFVYDYVNIGLPVYHNWDQLLDVIFLPFDEVCPENIDVISQKFHKHRDGDSSKRLYDYIISNS